MVIADAIAPSLNAIYASPDPSRLDIIFATWLFAIQIYCDFSGYTDIARGVAKMLSFKLMRNFAQPYFATNPQEFWRRWHISLSTWLRDYLYISLRGNRGTAFKTNRNLMLTMTLGGLWHGAAWNFIAWGVYQGVLLSAHRAFTNTRAGTTKHITRGLGYLVLRLGCIAIFFQIICYGWLLFRAQSFGQITDFSGRLLGLVEAPHIISMPLPPASALLGMLLLLIWDAMIERQDDVRFYETWPMVIRAGLYAGMIYLLAFGSTAATTSFIYFQF
jgi:alginate O-acetyltransferase complex protein AlgI